MPIPSLLPAPLFKRGFSTLALVPRSRAGNTFTIKVKDGVTGHYQQFSVGDILRAKVFNGTTLIDNWLRVDGIVNPGASAGYYAYTVTRMSGTAGLIPAGTAIVNYGPSGSSFISLSSDGAIGAAPNITIGKHAGTPWLSSTTLVRLGNLNGEYGVTSNLYGFGVGDYNGGNYLRYEPTNGFTLKAGTGNITIDSYGLYFSGGSGVGNTIRWIEDAMELGGIYSVHSASATRTSIYARGKSAYIATDVTTASLDGWNLNGIAGSTGASVLAVANAQASSYINICDNGFGTHGAFAGVLVNSTGTPKAMLDVRGGLAFNVTSVTDTYTVLVTDSTVVCNKATPFTVTLPTAVVNQVFTIKNIGAGVVTIDGAGSDTIDGALTKSLNQYDSATLQCTAANTWSVI